MHVQKKNDFEEANSFGLYKIKKKQLLCSIVVAVATLAAIVTGLVILLVYNAKVEERGNNKNNIGNVPSCKTVMGREVTVNNRKQQREANTENAVDMNEEKMPDPSQIPQCLSWWPNIGEYKACYVKITLNKPFTNNASMKSSNFGGTLMEIGEQWIGTRYAETSIDGYGNSYACLEYKCADNISPTTSSNGCNVPYNFVDPSSGEVDRTLIRVEPAGTFCNIQSINPNLINDLTNSQNSPFYVSNNIGGVEFVFYDSFGLSNYGIYSATDDKPGNAKSKALSKCMDPRSSAAVTFYCNEIKSNQTNAIPMIEDEMPDPNQIPQCLSWWPNYGNYSACYIKVQYRGVLIPTSTQTNNTGGTLKKIKDKWIGERYGEIFNDGSGNYIGCIEYKCANNISPTMSDNGCNDPYNLVDPTEGRVDNTLVEVKATETLCQIQSINTDLLAALSSFKLKTAGQSFSFYDSVGLSNYGVSREENSPSPIEAKRKALTTCIDISYPVAIEFNCDN